MQKIARFLRSRLPVLFAAATVAAILVLGAHHRGSYLAAWQLFRFPLDSEVFSDTRTVTDSIDCVLSGQNPYVVRTFDHWNRVYNYPYIWLDLRYLGITSRSTMAFGSALVAMYLGALLLLFEATGWVSAIIVCLGVWSRPSLFATERGNIDLAVFSLLVFGLFLIGRLERSGKWLGTGALVVFLTALKIYPIAVAATMLRDRKGIKAALVTALAALGGLLITSGRSLFAAIANTPQDVSGSYGSYPLFHVFSQLIFPPMMAIMERHHAVASAGGLLVAGFGTWAESTHRGARDRFLPTLDFDTVKGRIAVSCLSIYCFTFLAGSAYDYRLIFLLGVLAYLVDSLNENKSMRTVPACLGVLAFLWGPLARHNQISQLLDGLFFLVASGWLGSALLDRLPAQRI